MLELTTSTIVQLVFRFCLVLEFDFSAINEKQQLTEEFRSRINHLLVALRQNEPATCAFGFRAFLARSFFTADSPHVSSQGLL
mgnify:FL=1